jgi:ComF family protein
VELKRIVEALQDFIWPRRCAACDEKLAPDDAAFLKVPFCEICKEDLMPIVSPMCVCCGLPFDCLGPDHLCAECLSDPPLFSKARAVYEYGASSRDAVLRLKYGKTPWIGEALGRLLSDVAAASTLPDMLVPVPLHKKKLVARGFNQAALLAAPSAVRLGRPVRADLLRRVRETSPQAGQTRHARFSNLRGAFICDNESAVQGRRVLLIDDVITTGATVREASRTLREAGAVSVEVIAFARTC